MVHAGDTGPCNPLPDPAPIQTDLNLLRKGSSVIGQARDRRGTRRAV